MGTTCTHKPKGMTVAEFFIDHGVLRWGDNLPHTYRVLDSALVNLREFYAAIEQVHKQTGERRVWAAVILVTFYRPSRAGYMPENFCYKDMDESMGPYHTNCPERILKLLTSTEHEYAIEWRQRCWAKINRRKARPKNRPGLHLLYGGDVYTLTEPISGGSWRVLEEESGIHYRMKRRQVASAHVLGQP